MEMKSSLMLNIQKNDRVYQFIVPSGSPYGEAVDAAFEAFLQMDALRTEALNKIKKEKENKSKEDTKEVDAELINVQ